MSSSFKRRGKKVEVRSAAAPTRPGASSEAPSRQSSAKDRPNVVLSSSLLPGTKPWTNNLTLTSFGLREIDSFLFSSGVGSSSSNDGGGGQPLQTMIMLEEDRLTDDLARAFCRYWCAEGVAQRQLVLLGSLLPSVETSLELLDYDRYGDAHDVNYEGSTPEELHDFVLSLPRNLHLDKIRDKAKKQSSSSTSAVSSDGNTNSNREAISAIIEEEEEEGDHDNEDEQKEQAQNNDEGLINAWQYRKSIQDARSGISNKHNNEGTRGSATEGDGIYCHSYDLSKRMCDQFVSTTVDEFDGYRGENPLVTNTKIIDCSKALLSSPTTNTSNNGDKAMKYHHQGMALFCSMWKHLQNILSSHHNTVIRLYLPRLPVGPGAIAMPLLMSKVRKENLPVVVLATIRPWKWLSSPSSDPATNNKLDTLASLRSTTDVTLSLDSFSSLRTPPPPEFSLLQGILTLRKCAPFTASYYTDTITSKRPLAERFGVKRDGRKVTVQLLHLPPEELSKGGSSTSGVRSGGGGDNKDKQHGVGGCSSLGGVSLDF